MADALTTLARLRRLEEAEARRALGHAVGREADAERSVARAKTARLREFAAASAGDTLLAALAAWLPGSGRAIEAADAEAGSRRSDREEAARVLRTRRAALEAVETLASERRTAQRRCGEQRLQSRLDELGQRLGRPERGGLS